MGHPITDEDLECFGDKMLDVKKIYVGINLTFLVLILFLFTYFY